MSFSPPSIPSSLERGAAREEAAAGEGWLVGLRGRSEWRHWAVDTQSLGADYSVGPSRGMRT
jgi:hypothetical protein